MEEIKNGKYEEDGNIFWYKNGKLHREDGPAYEENYGNGDKWWYLNGKLHREDGPAMENANGNIFWYQHGKLHRKDGPAIEWNDGTKEWFINGKEYTENKFNQLLVKNEWKEKLQSTPEPRHKEKKKKL